MPYDIFLPGYEVYERAETEDHKSITMRVRRTRNHYAQCPQCGSTYSHQHGKDFRYVRDVPFAGKATYLAVQKHRYKCTNCGKVYTENFDFVAPRSKMTERFRHQIAEDTLRLTTFSDVASHHSLTVPTVRNVFLSYIRPKDAARNLVAPRVLGIDEIHIGDKARPVFTDIENHKLLEMREEQKAVVVIDALNQMSSPERIEVVTMDMCQAYRSAVQECLPDAAIVVDKFHIMKLLGTAIQVLADLA